MRRVSFKLAFSKKCDDEELKKELGSMRITVRQYAEGLYEAMKRAEGLEYAGIIDRFLALMKRDRRRKDIPFVFRHIERIAERESGVKRVEIISARPIAEASMRAVESEGEKVFGKERILFQQKIRPELFGGAMFRTESETFDATTGGRFRKLKQFLEGKGN